MATSSAIVAKLNLKPHPEGGFYSETFRDHSINLSKSILPPEYKVDRPISTAIYFLLPSGSISHLHRIPSAETWHFYLGEPITKFQLIDTAGIRKRTSIASSGSTTESLFVNRAFRAIRRSDVVALVIEALVLELNEEDGSVKLTGLGQNILEENQVVQYTVPPNVWFCAFPTLDYNISAENVVVKNPPRDSEKHFSLVGCTVAPAFQFEDFELAKCSQLVSMFPAHEALISLVAYP